RPDAALFGEKQTRVILSAKPENASVIRELAAAYGLACYRIGETGSERVRIALSGQETIDVPLSACREVYEGALVR
ncbi:MAG: hypothetical protein N2554_06620, partial [Fimbriimonadales bacterium]|nr:hypothetical protein [Fimbriimonadales bacterium]